MDLGTKHECLDYQGVLIFCVHACAYMWCVCVLAAVGDPIGHYVTKQSESGEEEACNTKPQESHACMDDQFPFSVMKTERKTISRTPLYS